MNKMSAHPSPEVRTEHLLEKASAFTHEIGIFRRQAKIILGAVLIGVLACLALNAFRERMFVSRVSLIVDNRRLEINRQDLLFTESTLDSPIIDSQIEILKSSKIAFGVIDKLQLMNDPAFLRLPQESKPSLFSFLGGPKPEPTTLMDRRVATLLTFQNRLSVRRIGLSYVVEIGFQDRDPVKAAKIANEVADFYLADQQQSSEESAQTASAWLRDRLKDLGPRARIISVALPTGEHVGLSLKILLAAALIASLLVGIALAHLRELLDKKIRTPEALEKFCGLRCLALMPALSRRSPYLRKLGGVRADLAAPQGNAEGVSVPSVLTSIRQQSGLLGKSEAGRITARTTAEAQFDRMLRMLQIEVQHSLKFKLGQVIAFAAPTREQGTTTVVMNLARNVVEGGAKVLVIQLETDGTTRSEAGDPFDPARKGAFDLHRRYFDFGPRPEFDLLRIAPQDWPTYGEFDNEIASYITGLREKYDLIILDLPSFDRSELFTGFSECVDSFILVVKWARADLASIAMVGHTMNKDFNKVSGAVINACNLRRMTALGSVQAKFLR
jgi:polysaccharide biosynthesis transport protein